MLEDNHRCVRQTSSVRVSLAILKEIALNDKAVHAIKQKECQTLGKKRLLTSLAEVSLL